MAEPKKFITKYGHEYRLNGKLHREDGPALEYIDGHKEWRINNELHREDGPAVEYADGQGSWFCHNRFYQNIDDWAKDVGIYGTDDHTLLKLKYG